MSVAAIASQSPDAAYEAPLAQYFRCVRVFLAFARAVDTSLCILVTFCMPVIALRQKIAPVSASPPSLCYEACTRAGRLGQCQGGELMSIDNCCESPATSRTTGPRRGSECALRATPTWSCGRRRWSRGRLREVFFPDIARIRCWGTCRYHRVWREPPRDRPQQGLSHCSTFSHQQRQKPLTLKTCTVAKEQPN